MLLVTSLLFITVAIMKFYGLNIIHRIKKINIKRSENKKKYDKIKSLACMLIGMVLLLFYLDSICGLYGSLESELLLDGSFVAFFVGIVLMIYAPLGYKEGMIWKSILKYKNNRGKIAIVCYLAMAISILLLILLGVIFNSEYGCDLEIYFLGMDTSIVFYILETLIVISLFLMIVIKKHDKKVIVFISILVTLGILSFSLFLCAFTTGGDYYTFSSPDRKHSIVIEEWSFLMGEGIRVYEKENLFFIKAIGSLSNNYLYHNYRIEWEENKAIVISGEGTENEEKCEFVLKNKK